MLNQGRPLLRAERSGARSEKGAGWKRAHARGRWKFGEGSEKGFVRYGFIVLMKVVPIRAGARLRRRVSGANTAGHWVGRRTDSPGGDKDHERSEYRSVLERQEFVVGNGALAEWKMTISERK